MGDIKIIGLLKGDQRFIFMFRDDNKSEALRQVGRCAANKELNFSWYDAALLSQKIRNA